MRILVVNRFFGGDQTPTGRMAADLAAELVKARHDVTIFASADAYTDSTQTERTGAWRVIRTATAGRGRMRAWLMFWVKSAAAMLRLEWDRCIVLTDPPFMIFAAAVCTVVHRTRRVYWWTMDLYPEALVASGVRYPLKQTINRVLAALTNRAIRRIRGVISLGDRQRDRLRVYRSWPADDSRFCLVQPPWDLRTIVSNRESVARLRSEFGWENRRVALYAGNLGEAHSFEEIANAAEALHAGGNATWVFAFFCRGARVSELRQRAEHLPNVFVHDYLPEDRLPALLNAADAHIVTMREGWEGIVVPSKLFGVSQTAAPVIFIGPDDADTAHEIDENALGVSLPPGVAPAALIAALASVRERLPVTLASDGPERVAAFLTK